MNTYTILKTSMKHLYQGKTFFYSDLNIDYVIDAD